MPAVLARAHAALLMQIKDILAKGGDTRNDGKIHSKSFIVYAQTLPGVYACSGASDAYRLPLLGLLSTHPRVRPAVAKTQGSDADALHTIAACSHGISWCHLSWRGKCTLCRCCPLACRYFISRNFI